MKADDPVKTRPGAPDAAENEEPPTDEPSASSGHAWAVLRPLVMRLHFYAGLFVAPFLLVAAVTGLLYVFTPQMDQIVYDHELHVPASPASQTLASQVDVARAELPGAPLSSVRPAPTPTDTTQVIFDPPELPESYYRTVFVDPHTAEVRGVLDTYGGNQALPLRAWIDNLHRGLHLGDTGRIYSEMAASWLWIVVLGGVVLWVQRRRKARTARFLLAPEFRPPGRRRILSWHGAVGLWAATGLVFLSATGLTWSVHAGDNITQLRSALSWETPTVSTTLPAEPAPAGSADVGFDRVRDTAVEHGLTGPIDIAPPEEAGSGYTVEQMQRHWPTQDDSIAVDPATGNVTSTLRFADFPLMAKLSRWGIDAHMGLLFGWVNQLVLVLLALGLICMIFWGYRMWWLRRPTRTGGSAFGRPPERGAWRRVPGKILAPIILVAVFVAYAVPLLGASLLLFLVVDIALGARARRRARSGGVV